MKRTLFALLVLALAPATVAMAQSSKVSGRDPLFAKPMELSIKPDTGDVDLGDLFAQLSSGFGFDLTYRGGKPPLDRIKIKPGTYGPTVGDALTKLCAQEPALVCQIEGKGFTVSTIATPNQEAAVQQPQNNTTPEAPPVATVPPPPPAASINTVKTPETLTATKGSLNLRRAALEDLLLRYPSQVSSANPDHQSVLDDLMERYPDAYNQYGLPGDFAQLNRLQQELNQPLVAQHLEELAAADTFRSYQTPYYGSGWAAPASYMGSLGYPYGIVVQEGAIKTNGDVSGTDLWINGCYAGASGQFDSWWNQKLPAHSGEMIVITVRRIKDNLSYDTPTRLTSQWIGRYVGAKHLPFSVNNDDLKRGKPFDRQAATVSCASSSIH
jgi:hypothetical protein